MIEIHADYNRDGRLDARSAEYNLRQTGRGALIRANLDADLRSLPSDSAVDSNLTLDMARTTKSAQENDLVPIIIKLTNFPLPANHRVELRTELGDDINIYDSYKRRLSFTNTPNDKIYVLALGTPNNNYYVEVSSLAFSPKGVSAGSGGKFGSEFRLRVYVLDPSNVEIASDEGRFSVSPLILVGDTEPIERLYMAEVRDNVPSVREMQSLDSRIGLNLKLIPESLNSGDTWIQDQFQMAYLQDPTGIMRVILHLPRMRSDSILRPNTPNLSTFIEGHFPSRNLGIFQDFWTRSLSVLDVNGQRVWIPFRQTEILQTQIESASRLRREIMRILYERSRREFTIESIQNINFFDFRVNVRRLAGLATAALGRAITAAPEDSQKEHFRALRAALDTAVSAFESSVAVGNVNGAITVRITIGTNSSVELVRYFSDKLEGELSQIMDSLNFGGNIEVSPPVENAPFGKLVIGNLSYQDQRIMDPALKEFLAEQSAQPIVEINTSWLHVGHVDEVMSFCPTPNYGSAGSAILRASPGIALKIIEAAADLFFSGISWALRRSFSPAHSPGYYERRMSRGAHPITHMLRGKFWIHRHNAGPNSPQPLEPPIIYKKLVDHWSHSIFDVNLWGLKYIPGPGPDRQYPANISIEEFVGLDNATNYCIEDVLLAARPMAPDAISGGGMPESQASVDAENEERLQDCRIGEGMPEREKAEFRQFLDGHRLEDILKGGFPTLPIIQLPVLFDRLDVWQNESTIAFIPDLVNFQQHNRHIIIPRPYGPRMRINDCIAVLNTAMAEMDSSFVRNLNARWIAQRQLDQTWHWHYGGSSASDQVTIETIVKYFKDGFVTADGHQQSDDDIANSILRHPQNRAKFRGRNLRVGWQKIFIPEGNVDLFEAYTQLVLEQLGLTVHWVDSWYYHLHSGGIHCGTNALRTVQHTRSDTWWNSSTSGTL